MKCVQCLAALAVLSQSLGIVQDGNSKKKMSLERDAINALPMERYKHDCWQKRPVALTQNALALMQKIPGAGIDKFEPFKTVEKDGFLEVACVKDYMYYHGDKFGDNKFSYKIGDSSNVSIVHYASFVANEDQQSMSPTVCFEFCRTVPHMGFFGIMNGRDCYCAPYYKPMESGSSNCDSVCEGEPTLMCGGSEKSTVWGMHMCASTEKDLGESATKASSMKSSMESQAGAAKDTSTKMETSANALQSSFSAAGDSSTTFLTQSAKVFAGDLLHKAESLEKIATKLGNLKAAAAKITKFSDPKEVTEAEGIMDDIEAGLVEGAQVAADLEDLTQLATPTNLSVAGAAAQYYPLMYFVDKQYNSTPQTCGGDTVGKPVVGLNFDGCAAACDKYAMGCVGFSFYNNPKNEPLCFLFSRFETAFYFTGCGSFLQLNQWAPPYDVKCMVKFARFSGTTLKPDPSGTCSNCLKKVTKAERCFK